MGLRKRSTFQVEFLCLEIRLLEMYCENAIEVTEILKRMVNAGVVKIKGNGRGTKYHL